LIEISKSLIKKFEILKSLQEKTDQIAEMTEIMKHAVNLDEQAMNETEERLQSLLVENRGLKEILKIKSKYGAYEPNNNIITNNTKAKQSNLVDREVQTEQISGGSESETKRQEDKLEISKLMDLLVLNTEQEKQESKSSQVTSSVEELTREEVKLIDKIEDVIENENQSANETTVLQSIENLGEGIHMFSLFIYFVLNKRNKLSFYCKIQRQYFGAAESSQSFGR